VSGLLPGTLIVNGQGQQGIPVKSVFAASLGLHSSSGHAPASLKHQPGDKFRMPEDDEVVGVDHANIL
jgi:hypothetical protein